MTLPTYPALAGGWTVKDKTISTLILFLKLRFLPFLKTFQA
jgi:hypothetical protein